MNHEPLKNKIQKTVNAWSMIHGSWSVSSGFTIIELMISVALFTIVVTISIGSVLQIQAGHRKSHEVRQVLDTLNFVMEDMARNVRLGHTYKCDAGGTALDPSTISGADCAFDPNNPTTPVKSIAFVDVNGTVTVYRFRITDASANTGEIVKSKNGNTCLFSGTSSPQCPSLTPPEVKIDMNKSGFSVKNSGPDILGAGAASGVNDTIQPRATIRITGSITYESVSTPFSIQTTITQRQPNITVAP